MGGAFLECVFEETERVCENTGAGHYELAVRDLTVPWFTTTSRMWRVLLSLCWFSCLHKPNALENSTVITPQNCTMDCIVKGDARCEYCRITREDVKMSIGSVTAQMFERCVPRPCTAFLSSPSSDVCQHYVQAPHSITVEFMNHQNPKYDTVILSWKPSQYGIEFLRGFQVSVQALGGPYMGCQLFLFHRNLSLSAAHSNRVYQSDPFMHLPLDAQFSATVMALPVPELWSSFHHSTHFSTHSCPEKNRLEFCQRDWHPEYVEVKQEGRDVLVTFNLAPPHLGISHYFSLCYGGGIHNYTAIKPNQKANKSHHSYYLLGLKFGTNYSCEIAADVVDAVRKSFTVQVAQIEQGPSSLFIAEATFLVMLLPMAVVLTILCATLLIILNKRKAARRPGVNHNPAESTLPCDDKCVLEEHNLVMIGQPKPPRLLICYSCADGPAHVSVVLHFAAFLQRHMATQVCLDLWDALSLAEEGSLSWHCRQIQESDFVLVVCSQGLQHQMREVDQIVGGDASLLAVSLIGEELGRAKSMGQGLSKFLTAVFEYSDESYIPGVLCLTSHYVLMRDLPLLFSHLHRVALQRPGRRLQVEHVSEDSYFKLPGGAALQRAICQAAMECEHLQSVLNLE